MMLGLSAGPRRRRCRGAGEARRFPARFPRRHHPSLDARDHARARHARRVPQAPASEGARARRHQIGDERIVLADFSHLPTHCRFIAFMPQWDFLDFLAEPGAPLSELPSQDAGRGRRICSWTATRCSGLQAKTPDGSLEIRADLVVGADGRHSTVRELAGLEGRGFRRADGRALVPPVQAARATASRRSAASRPAWLFVMLDRGDYWQCAYVIPKAASSGCARKGLEAFRARRSRRSTRRFADRVGEIASWDDVKLLTVTVDRLKRWYRPGLLCIGDAAHAMSPVGGVGINLAIQDAVAAANILWRAAAQRARVGEDCSPRCRQRREWPTKMMQRGAALRAEAHHQQRARA